MAEKKKFPNPQFFRARNNMDLKKQAEAGDRFTPDTLPAGAPHAEFVKATDAMNARLDALDLSEVEIEEIEDPKE